MSRRYSTSRQGRLTLDLSDLRTVRYIQAQPAVRKAWNNTTTNYEKGKKLPAVGLLFVWFEMYSSWLWRTVHAVPYPEFMIHMVYQIDDRAERALEYTINQTEWVSEKFNKMTSSNPPQRRGSFMDRMGLANGNKTK